MNKYAPRQLKVWDKLWALRFKHERIRNKVTQRIQNKTTTTVERCIVLDIVKAVQYRQNKKVIVAYTVKNDLNEVYTIERRYLFVRKNDALNSLYSYVKSILWNNLSDFISKNKK